MGPVLPSEIAPGLLRWTAPHPDWEGEADGWERDVGCALFEADDALVLIDPLLPSDGRAEFLAWLDARVDGGPVSILTTIHWHARDREELAERYRANSSRAWNYVPAGVKPRPLRGAGETVFWLPAVRALVPGDRLVGAKGELRLCREEWLQSTNVDRAGLAALMRPLLELDIERVLVSHGEPVLHDARAVLAHALAEAAPEA
jgi:hypothetical protein